jgi:hypothetical protein
MSLLEMATHPGAFELAVLLAVIRLGDEAYGRRILAEVKERLKRGVSAGAVASSRSKTITAGIVAGAATAVMAAVFSAAGTGALLALAHGPATMMAITGSGGLEEAFILPIMLVVPGGLTGTVGAVAAALGHRALAATSKTAPD